MRWFVPHVGYRTGIVYDLIEGYCKVKADDGREPEYVLLKADELHVVKGGVS